MQSNSDLIKHFKKFIVNERKALFNTKIEERTQHLTIALENIFQARNISASIRSADCFGIQDIQVIENDNLVENDSEVSMGAEKWITIKRYNNQKNNSIQAI